MVSLRSLIRRSLDGPPSSATRPPTGDATTGGVPARVDSIEGAPLPLVRVIGWFASATLPAISLKVRGRTLQPLHTARQYRPDVVAAGACEFPFCGFRSEFLLGPGDIPEAVVFGERSFPVPDADRFGTIDPHYSHLFIERRVLGRTSIYGSGPPTEVALEFKQFVRSFSRGRILDFGCGNGDLVRWLRGEAEGLDASGLELDEPRVRNVTVAEARDHVAFYDGGDVLPFADASFDTIASTEVIEHISGIERYVPELARILAPGGRLVLTTPDITAIPSLFATNTVPWHLLESTHVNFFTPASVEALFSTHFRLDTLCCLGAGRVNGLFAPGSIGAVFVRRDRVTSA